MERQKSGRIHFHLLVVASGDIRTGLSFDQVARRIYGSGNARLRAEWAFWRNTAPRYGFGRTELLPIRKGGEEMATYVGKYLDKHQVNRLDIDKGVHLVSSSRGLLPSVSSFSSNTEGASLWRRKLGAVAKRYGIASREDFRERFGPKWGWQMRRVIKTLDLVALQGGEASYSSARQAAMDGHALPDEVDLSAPCTITRDMKQTAIEHPLRGVKTFCRQCGQSFFRGRCGCMPQLGAAGFAFSSTQAAGPISAVRRQSTVATDKAGGCGPCRAVQLSAQLQPDSRTAQPLKAVLAEVAEGLRPPAGRTRLQSLRVLRVAQRATKCTLLLSLP
jgi:hypothetical protein